MHKCERSKIIQTASISERYTSHYTDYSQFNNLTDPQICCCKHSQCLAQGHNGNMCSSIDQTCYWWKLLPYEILLVAFSCQFCWFKCFSFYLLNTNTITKPMFIVLKTFYNAFTYSRRIYCGHSLNPIQHVSHKLYKNHYISLLI